MKENSKRKLTNKQELFCREYIIDFNATQAYIRAGYKAKNENTAGVQANKLLRNTKIVKYIEELKRKREEKLDINAQYVLEQAVEVLHIAMGREAHKSSYTKGNEVKKVDVFKTNLREANNALKLIGQHTDVKAFEVEKMIIAKETFTITLPKELTPKAQGEKIAQDSTEK